MKNLVWLVIMGMLVVSCGDDTPDKTEYKDGVFVVNQGAFLTGTGTISFLENGSDIPVQDVFSTSNNGQFLGNIAQSMMEFDGKKYISINNGGKIMVANDRDFTFLDSISGINQPRYFASNSDKLYVSSWGITGSDGGVYEINTSSNTLSTAIVSGNGPEGMVIEDGLLYIAKGGGFGRDSSVVIVDTEDNSIVKTLNVPDNPEQIVSDEDGNIYVICGGYSDFNDPSNNTEGALVHIEEQEIVSVQSLPNGSSRLAIDRDEGFLYYTANGKVLKQSTADLTSPATEVASVFAYALAFDEDEKLLYVADPVDFSSAGAILVYDQSGTQVKSFTAGIIPGFIHFD